MKRKRKRIVPEGPNLGRATEYKLEYVDMAFTACSEMGANERKLANLFQVSERTIRNWRRKHSEFDSAVALGKDEWDALVAEQSLLKRVCGYEYTERHETEQLVYVREEGAKKAKKLPGLKVKTIKKHIVPDVGAVIFWLCNRRPDRWKNIKFVQVEGGAREREAYNEQIEGLKRLPTYELEQLAEILAKAEDKTTNLSNGRDSTLRDKPKTLH